MQIQEVQMIGIYKITNMVNGKSYIGQSRDIERRWREHKNSKDDATIHRAFRKYGIANFTFEVLEECSAEELDQKEIEYIAKYNSYKKGYNSTLGGQKNFVGPTGEKHSQAKLLQYEVNKIYEMLQSGQTVSEVTKLFPQISKSTISMINQGHIWKKEGYTYPLSNQTVGSIGSKNPRALVDEETVMEMRTYYVSHSFQETKDKYQYLKPSTVRAIVYGESWKNLPVYSKKKGAWI